MHIVLLALLAAAPVASPTPAAKAAVTPKPAVTSTPAPTPTPAPASPSSTLADPDLGRVGSVGAALGFALTGGKLGPTTGFALSFRRSVMPSLVVGLEVGYTQASASGTLSNPGLPPGQGYKVAVTTVPIVATALYHRIVGPVWIVAGGGPVVAPVTSKASAGGGTNTETGTAFGVELVAGTEFPLGPGALSGDLRYRYLSASGIKSTGSGNLGGPGVQFGYRVRF